MAAGPFGPRYSLLPSQRMNQKMKGSSTSPTVNPPPCPKLFDTSLSTMIDMTKRAMLPR